jgi:hypothetical protein
MKKVLLVILALLLAGCSSDIKLSAFSQELQAGPVTQVGFVQLPGSAYPIRHNMESVRSMNFAVLSNTALENAVKAKRKKWKWVYPANITAVNASVPEIFVVSKDALKEPLADSVKQVLAKVSSTLNTRYYFVIENISVKDVSSPQVPFTLVAGVCLQMWDFQEGKMVYRVRDTSRQVPYSGDDFKKKIEEALFYLFCEMVSPLPKN